MPRLKALNLFLGHWGVGNLDDRQYTRQHWTLIKQVLCLIALTDALLDKGVAVHFRIL